MNINSQHHQATLQSLAHRAMIERGLLPDFSPQARTELDGMQSPAAAMNGELVRDLTHRLWASIDNDDSRDLDQLTVAEILPGDKVKLLVAIADVEALVKNGSVIDAHARHNTTSVYTAARIFPMLPEKLSTDLTSLNANVERLAVVVEMVIGVDGSLQNSDIYRARVRNHAQLAYHNVSAWLAGGDMPDAVAAVKGLAENLRLQDRTAQRLRHLRHIHGALSLKMLEARPLFDGEQVCAFAVKNENRAKEMIEDFMIAANSVTARYLASRKLPSIRRVVHTPKRWGRIVKLAGDHGFKLPDAPDSKALDAFLIQEKAADPLHFPDLSLAVINLLGAGKYIAELADDTAPGHFGLAVKDYAHSTAPNRRYADLVTQRLLKAALAGRTAPYTYVELDTLARHLTVQENAVNKVERQIGKSAAALLLEARIGEQFEATITGAATKGTWVRLFTVPIEGKLIGGFADLDVGDRVRVQLTAVDVPRGFIDFEQVNLTGC